ncbi:acyl-CoA N-acyltransferase [Microdochium trichocladiopsis]|uniref:Acyl-CoA N-acyltransferase n=1 Tax=Microdochium trichocladiopsis TaxID=1682393 RepID=A0A9P8Y5R7_9PEZI|nr:acyl-CoA N-acyltransferase [Microdochium trichocladiopsis]KAH7028933.1 acyl-CoA N-acyltransferase [Microdochium trichocladiopsis]
MSSSTATTAPPATTPTTITSPSPSSSSQQPKPKTKLKLKIRRAVAPADVAATTALINAAFRADDTTDVYLGAEHERISLATEESVLGSMTATDIAVFVGVVSKAAAVDYEGEELEHKEEEEEEIVGHFWLQKKSDTLAWLALLAVSVKGQGQGWGSQLVAHAEQVARDEWKAQRLEFDVVNTRSTLRRWYEKRGFVPTGRAKPFAYELHPDWEGVLRADLEFLYYGKDL